MHNHSVVRPFNKVVLVVLCIVTMGCFSFGVNVCVHVHLIP